MDIVRIKEASDSKIINLLLNLTKVYTDLVFLINIFLYQYSTCLQSLIYL